MDTHRTTLALVATLAALLFAPWWVAALVALVAGCTLVLLRWVDAAPSQEQLWPSGVQR